MKILNLIKKNPFIRNVIILSSGTAAAQIIGMLLSPVITRLYGPEAYGLMGTFTAIIAIISPIAALTFPIAIVLPKPDREANQLIQLSLLMTIIISLIVGFCIMLFYEQIVSTFNLGVITNFLYLIPIVLVTAGILQILEQWSIRTKQFGISAKSTFLQSMIVNGGKVGIGLFYPVASVLILFSSVTQGLKAFIMLLYLRNSDFKMSFNVFKKNLYSKTLIKEYKDFPLYRAPQTVVNSISESFPVLLLASLFGPSSVGFYNIGRMVLNIPTQLIGKSVGDVFYPQISNVAMNNESVTKILKKATLILVGIAIVPFGVVIIFGPILFSFVFGANWLVAGEYARWIAFWSFSSFILQPAVRALPVLLAQKLHLIYTVISLIIRVAMLGIGYFVFSSDIIAIALFGASSGLLNIILIFITIFIGRRFDASRYRE